MVLLINMLGIAKRTKTRILQAPTSEEYGDPDVYLQSEKYWVRANPIGVCSCYDEGKRCAETIFSIVFVTQWISS
jgi:UDP-glucuronate decarboxylase